MKLRTSKKLYVGNLSVLIDEANLSEALKSCGEIESMNIVLNDNSRSRRCYAVVEMSSHQEADIVLSKLNGSVFQGRALRIKKI